MEYPMTAQATKRPDKAQRRASEQHQYEVARTLEKELNLLVEERKERAERLGLKIALN
jgi:hypothetical protein